jgi:hypothetical protein
MVIQQIEPDEVVSLARKALALPNTSDVHDDAFLAALVRRAAAIVCPCSSGTLERAVMEGLFRLAEDPSKLTEDIEAAVEKAMIAGDLLELHQVATDDPNVKGTWLFSAPPAFVARPSGSVFILGVTPDGPSALPASLSERILYERHCRIIEPQPSENLAQMLRELGLLELSERNWLRLPRQESQNDFLAKIERELHALGPSGEVSELKILASDRDPSYYIGRWTIPKRESGCFVARRPQAYGAALWGFALLKDGVLEKFLDFPPKKSKFRGSDFAWHLQMAIDATRGAPQTYRRRFDGGQVRLDFFSPIPLWAERRLGIVGRPVDREKCLFSYEIPEREAEAEEKFLQTYLWITPNSPHGGS